jgi:CHAT domain-containing protein
MKLQRIVLATIVALFFCIPISLPASAQEEDYYGEDSSNTLVGTPEQQKADSLIQSVKEKLGLGSLSEKKAALEEVKKALAIYQNLGSKLDNTKYDRIEVATTFLCSTYSEVEDWTNTIKYCQELAKLETKKGTYQTYSGYLVKAYLGIKNYSNAIEVLQARLNTTKNQYENTNYCQVSKLSKQECESQKNNHIIPNLEQLGEAHFLAKNYDRSVKYYQEAIDVNSQTRDSELSSLRTNLGYALLRAGNIIEAEKELLTALRNTKADIEKWNNSQSRVMKQWNVPSIFFKFNVLGVTSSNDKKLYQALQELKVQQGKYQEALNFSQKLRAGGLSAFLSNQKDFQPLDSITVEQIQNVAQEQKATLVEYSLIEEDKLFIWVIPPNGEIHFRQVDLTSPPPTQVSTNVNFIFKISILAIGIAASLILLRRKKSLVVLGIAATILAGFILPFNQQKIASTNQDSKSSSKLSNFSFANLTHATFASLTGEDRGILSESLDKGNCQDNDECLEQLYQLLIEPIAEFLPQNPEEQVIFIPQGELFRVSFAALKDSNNQYLIEKHTIRTAPSIEMLKLTNKLARQKSSNTFTQALVVGNPIMPKVKIDLINPAKQLDSLTGTEKEAQAVAKLLNTSPLIGKQATESNVVNQITNAKLIHLATHGVLNVRKVRHFNCSLTQHSKDDEYYTPPQDEYEYETSSYDVYDELLCDMLNNTENPGVDVLALTPSGQDDGLLNEIEIYKKDLNAELVVLSACETGLGTITSDGVVGLARPFLTKGVPSVVVSLWQVPDAPTSELMVEFYKNLQKNSDKAQALRQAMLTIKDKYPEPYNWAAFTLVGEN